MTNDELRAAIAALWPGHGGQAEAARQFNIDGRRMRSYLAPAETSNHRAVPEWMARDITALLAQFPDGMRQVDPRLTISILHDQMQRAGWTAEESAAAILGAAHAHAVSIMGEDAVSDLR